MRLANYDIGESMQSGVAGRLFDAAENQVPELNSLCRRYCMGVRFVLAVGKVYSPDDQVLHCEKRGACLCFNGFQLVLRVRGWKYPIFGITAVSSLDPMPERLAA